MNKITKIVLMILSFPFLGVLLLFKPRVYKKIILMKDNEIQRDWVTRIDEVTFTSLYAIWFNIFKYTVKGISK